MHRHRAEQRRRRSHGVDHLEGVEEARDHQCNRCIGQPQENRRDRPDRAERTRPMAIPAIAPGVTTPGGGYLDLACFGITPIATGDESNTNFNTPPYLFGGERVYQDRCRLERLHQRRRQRPRRRHPVHTADLAGSRAPNGVLAPYWTDLDDGGTNPALSVGILPTGSAQLDFVQWDAHVFGDPSAAGSRRMQVWIGINGVEDISYGYDANTDRCRCSVRYWPHRRCREHQRNRGCSDRRSSDRQLCGHVDPRYPRWIGRRHVDGQWQGPWHRHIDVDDGERRRRRKDHRVDEDHRQQALVRCLRWDLAATPGPTW